MNTKIIGGIRALDAVIFAAILSSFAGWATGASAEHTFFCKATISSLGDPGPVSLSGPLVYDLGTTGSCTDAQHVTQFNAKCEVPAHDNCSTKAAGDANFNSAAFWCAKGVPDGSLIRAYAEVGASGKYKAAQTKGIRSTSRLSPRPRTTAMRCRGPGSTIPRRATGVTRDA